MVKEIYGLVLLKVAPLYPIANAVNIRWSPVVLALLKVANGVLIAVVPVSLIDQARLVGGTSIVKVIPGVLYPMLVATSVVP